MATQVTPISMLFLAAAPFVYQEGGEIKSLPALNVQLELDRIIDSCRSIPSPVAINIDVGIATEDVIGHCFATRQSPLHIFHFTGHGAAIKGAESTLILEDELGNARTIDQIGLERLLRPAGEPPCYLAFLSACHSEGLAEALLNLHVPHVVVINANDTVLDIAASEFAARFYPALLAGQSVATAFEAACTAVAYDDLLNERGQGTEELKFKLLPHNSMNHHRPLFNNLPSGIVTAQSFQNNSNLQRTVINDIFIGRSKELLSLSTQILRHNERFLHIYGLGGMGKTALALAFGRWIDQRSRFRDGVTAIELRGWRSADQVRIKISLTLNLDPKAASDNNTLVSYIKNLHILLIFDDIDDLLEHDNYAAIELFNSLIGCRRVYLLTTGRRILPGVIRHKGILINRLDSIDSERTFMAYAPPIGEWFTNRSKVAELLTIFDGYPFPIRLVARYLTETRCSLTDLIDRLKLNPQGTFRYPSDTADRNTSLAITLDLSFAALPVSAQQMFTYLAWFPAGTWRNWIEQIFGEANKLDLDILIQYGMIDIKYSSSDQDHIRLPEPARLYAESKLDAETTNIYGLKILEHYSQMTTVADSIISGGKNPIIGLTAISEEWPNIERWIRWGYQNESIKGKSCHSAKITSNLDAYWMFSQTRGQTIVNDLLNGALNTARVALDLKTQADILQILGDIQRFQGNFYSSVNNLNLSRNIYREIKYLSGEAYVLLILGELQRSQEIYNEAERTYLQALETIQSSDNIQLQAHILRGLGDVYVSLNQIHMAEINYHKAYLIYQEIEDHIGQANTLLGKGNIQRMMDCFDNSEELLVKALFEYKFCKDKLGEANILSLIGQVQKSRGKYDIAEKNYIHALNIYKDLDYSISEANILILLGDINYAQKRYDIAEKYYQRTLMFQKKFGNIDKQIEILNELRKISFILGNTDKSEYICKSLLYIHRQNGLLNEIAEVLLLIGNINTIKNNIHKSRKYYENALKIYQSLGDINGEIKVLQILGNIYAQNRIFDESERFHQKALMLSQEIGNKQEEIKILELLGDENILRNDYDKAEYYYYNALNLCFEGAYEKELADICGALSCLYLRKDDVRAKIYLFYAVSIYKKIGHDYDCALILRKFGMIIIQYGNVDYAQPFILHAINIMEESNTSQLAIQLQNTLQQKLHDHCIRKLAYLFVQAAKGVSGARNAADQWLHKNSNTEEWYILAKVMKEFLNNNKYHENLLNLCQEGTDFDRKVTKLAIILYSNPEQLNNLQITLNRYNPSKELVTDHEVNQLALMFAHTVQGHSSAQLALKEWFNWVEKNIEWRPLRQVIQLIISEKIDLMGILNYIRQLNRIDIRILTSTIILLNNQLDLSITEYEIIKKDNKLTALVTLIASAFRKTLNERKDFAKELEYLSINNHDIYHFILVSRRLILGYDPHNLLDKLNDNEYSAWKQLITLIETDMIRGEVLEGWIENTIAVLGPAVEHQQEWFDFLSNHLLPQMSSKPYAEAFIKALIELIKVNGDIYKLNPILSPSFHNLWNQIISTISEQQKQYFIPESIMEIIISLAKSLRGSPEEKYSMNKQLSDKLCGDSAIDDFIIAAQHALFGVPLDQAGKNLSGVAHNSWTYLNSIIENL